MTPRAFQAVPVFLFALLVSTAAVASQAPDPAARQKTRSAGAHWLVQHQNPDGGWGSGGFGGASTGQGSDVATTALSVMALLRDAKGGAAHRDAIERGVRYVLEVIESSPGAGPRLAVPEGTQPQHKLGPNVDTHFAALLLSEVDERLGEDLYRDAQLLYDKVLTKVVHAQRGDGSFDANGWAPVLSSSVAAQSLYKAHAKGKQIERDVLEKNERYSQSLIDQKTGRLDSSAGAGVDLYAAATSLAGNRNAAKAAAPGEARAHAEAAADKTAEIVRQQTARMISGFGSVGGEEMLSYMLISDSLAEQGGDDFRHWHQKITSHLDATQNADGSWSGHHCITSTPFVTAAAVMTLGTQPGADETAANQSAATLGRR